MSEATTSGFDEHVEQLTVPALPTSNEEKSFLYLTQPESLLDELLTRKPGLIWRKQAIHCNTMRQEVFEMQQSGQFDTKSI